MASNTNDRLSLLGLPPELRDRIYAFAVTDVQPLPAFALTHYRRRTSDDNKSFDMTGHISGNMQGRVIHETKAFPMLPLGAYASRELFYDLTAAFYRVNTFIFSLKNYRTWIVPSWYQGLPSMQTESMIRNLRHIVLEFLVCCDPGVAPQHGEIDAKLLKHQSLTVEFGGVLHHECTCWIKRMAAEYTYERDWRYPYENPLLCFAVEFERLCAAEMTDRQRAVFTSCKECGKAKADHPRDSVTAQWAET